MTEEMAYEILKRLIDEHFDENGNVKAFANIVIDELVGKEIPKKPDYEGDGYGDNGEIIYDTWICPNCDKRYELDYDDYDYCPNCGQRIDWSDEDVD